MESTRTCTVDGCDRPFNAKNYCRLHYIRFLKWGDPSYIKPRTLRRDAKVRSLCSVSGCQNFVGEGGARGYCPTHYSRFRRNGMPGSSDLKRKPSPSQCALQDCDATPRAGGYCSIHYRRKRTHGAATFLYMGECLLCGTALSGARVRSYCNRTCAALYRSNDGMRPETASCVRCGGLIDLMSVSGKGHRKRADSRMCAECKRGRSTRHGYSVAAIVSIHGSTDCGICHQPVDLTLRHPHRLSASIDHVMPYARGGSNEPDNLQLAHLHCNHVKSDRVMT